MQRAGGPPPAFRDDAPLKKPGAGLGAAGGSSSSSSATLPLQEDAALLKTFLETFDDVHGPGLKYERQLVDISLGEAKALVVDLDDLVDWRQPGDHVDDLAAAGAANLVQRVTQNAMRYVRVMEEVADGILAEKRKEGLDIPDADEDFLLKHRREAYDQALLALESASSANGTLDAAQDLRHQREAIMPSDLFRRYQVCLRPPAKTRSLSLREVKSAQIGSLIKVRGIVTRAGEVLPRMLVACYYCSACRLESYQVVKSKEFTPLGQCPTKACKEKSSVGDLTLNTKLSKFVTFQEIRIQELPDQVPVGSVPRHLVVEARGECTRRCTPGDVVEVTGIFLPEKPKFSFGGGGGGGRRGGGGGAGNPLVSTTYLHCMDLVRQKKADAQMDAQDEDFESKRRELLAKGNAYEQLARSLAPEIYGHDDVKKAILLMLVGGVSKQTKDGMRIRGDINVALFGDPGVAKSQLLKHVVGVAPRAVYTTGKGSSGVGLTAAVVRDAFTGEVALEGGALVLADMGICCIDEFDKMEEADRTAIHEVMEQQTVSIAKAGITTTLNARTSILAAANPMYGRYNKKLSPTENINLPAALLSRFDLLFLLLDKCDADSDRSLSEHITHVHRFSRHPARTSGEEPLSPKFIRSFVAQARDLHPVVPSTTAPGAEGERGRRLVNHIVEAYVEMRSQDGRDAKNNHAKSTLTPRQLLSILRLASAHCRVRGSQELDEVDVDEAIRLVIASKSSLEEDDDGGNKVGGRGNNNAGRGGKEQDDAMSRIFRKISDMLTSRKGEEDAHVTYGEVEERVLRMGFTRDLLDRTLREYERPEVGVLHLNHARTKIRFAEVE